MIKDSKPPCYKHLIAAEPLLIAMLNQT